MMDRLAALSAFVAVADRGSFAAAARHLRVSPPAVTRAVAGLEERLGAALFRRTTRSVSLTDEGAAFLERCRSALSELSDAEQAVMGARAEVQGRLAVTAPVMFGRLHVVPILAAMLRQHPKLTVDLSLVDRNVQLAEEGVDVAVRIGELADSALVAVRVGAVRRVLVASPAYLAAHGEPAEPGELGRHALIAFTGVSPRDEWRVGSAPREGGRERPHGSPSRRTAVAVRPRFVVNSADAAIAAALEDLGITRVLSYQVSAELAAGRLRTVLDGSEGPPLPIHVLFAAERRASPKLRRFVEDAKRHFRDAPL